jgi:serine/threonine-protein kinase RsbT
MIELPIRNEDDVSQLRQHVRQVAEKCRFDAFASAAMVTATSELARNVLVHGKGGAAQLDEVTSGPRVGIRLVVSDSGPGIPDIERVLAGGYSTVRSLGLGLSGTRRLVDEFAIESTVGRGTKVTVTKWKRTI